MALPEGQYIDGDGVVMNADGTPALVDHSGVPAAPEPCTECGHEERHELFEGCTADLWPGQPCACTARCDL